METDEGVQFFPAILHGKCKNFLSSSIIFRMMTQSNNIAIRHNCNYASAIRFRISSQVRM